MPEIILENVTKRFGKTTAVDNISIVIDDRSFVTLLGPSGCGKTTILRMITGFETPTEGDIYIDGKLVFSAKKDVNIPASKRGVGFLFQNYALWPHMTVYENISFGLVNAKWSKQDVRTRVDELLDTLQIAEYEKRYPSELSGGQQQRVAIARTLSTGPKILFMDEPLSNLDAQLRNEMRVELKRLHEEFDSTFVYVTHDQLEAMTLSTKICLLERGVIKQYAEPLELYNESSNMFTASFVGNPTTNLISTEVVSVGKTPILKALDREFKYTPKGKLKDLELGEQVVMGIRPEFMQIHKDGKIAGEVYSTLPSGMETIVKIKIGSTMITSVIFGGINFDVNSTINLDIISENILLFDPTTENKISRGSLELV